MLNGIYLFKVNNRNTRAVCEICSKLTIKMLKVNNKGIRTTSQNDVVDVALLSLLVTLNIFHTLC